MNIVTVPFNSTFYYIRPDISLNRDSNDYFCPECISEITVVPFIYIRMDKAGKSIASKFAERYYSQIGYGLNLSAKSLVEEGIPLSAAMANSLDNTTYVSDLNKFEEFNIGEFASQLREFAEQKFIRESGVSVRIHIAEGRDGDEVRMDHIREMFNRKIALITPFTSVRSGDYIAIELSDPVPLPFNRRIKFGEISFMVK